MAVSLTATVSAGGGAIQDSIADFSDTIEIRNFVVYDDNGNRVFGTLTSALGFTYPQAPVLQAPLKGDVNRDGRVDATDVQWLMAVTC